MPSVLTKSQRAKLRKKAKAKYHVDKRRGKLSYKKLWQFAYVGNIPIEKLYKCYGIRAE